MALQVIRASVLVYLILYCIFNLKMSNLRQLIKNVKNSKSQIFQDLMIIATMTELKKLNDFYFVEFGATNGISLSNTYMFERNFHAKGVVAEPARVWHSELKTNRKCKISLECVWGKSGNFLEFMETNNPDLSGLVGYEKSVNNLSENTKYQVKTISLVDLLATHGAPRIVDFLSIDTEGSEFEILECFDFQRYKFRTIVCEHNYGPNRARIKKLLESNGYKRKHKFVSFFDDWYYLDKNHFE